MKLIDIDAFEKDNAVKWVIQGKKDSYYSVGYLLNRYEVKAIPIEFIEKWKSGKTSIEQVVADKIMMDYKYKDYWEKENENRDTESTK